MYVDRRVDQCIYIHGIPKKSDSFEISLQTSNCIFSTLAYLMYVDRRVDQCIYIHGNQKKSESFEMSLHTSNCIFSTLIYLMYIDVELISVFISMETKKKF